LTFKAARRDATHNVSREGASASRAAGADVRTREAERRSFVDGDQPARHQRPRGEVATASPTTSYWLAQALPPVPTGALSGPVDVVVVGGGVTGCSCALTLARGGLRVRLLEAEEIASGASGRNGGFALRGLCAPYDEVRETLGADQAQLHWALTERTLDRMSMLAGGDALRRVGSLRLAVDAVERDVLEREYETLREDGFDAAWLDPMPQHLARLFAGGFVHPGDGALVPALWVRQLAGHAAAAGVEIVEHHPVDRDAVEALDAGAVVLAVDGMTDALVPELRPFVSPMRGQVIATEPLELLYDRPHYSRGGYDYWQQLPDGRLILGGRRDTSLDTERTTVDQTTAPIQEQLEGFAAELFRRVPVISHRWSGFWGQTADLLPLAGRLPGSDRIWLAGGYSGHGNVLGFECGDLVAQAILGKPTPELGAFDPARAFVSGSTT
jgi:glycine/D-amino acid oxidase-like deaminating enzyme